MEVGLVDHELVQRGLGSQRHLVAFRIVLRMVTQVLPCYPVLIPDKTHPTIKRYLQKNSCHHLFQYCDGIS
jgi:hypothetical protein